MNAIRYIKVMLLGVATVLGACSEEIPTDQDPVRNPSETIIFTTNLESLNAPALTRTVGGHLRMEMEEWPVSLSKADQQKQTRAETFSVLTGEAGLYAFEFDNEFTLSTPRINNARYDFQGSSLIPVDPYAWANFTKDNILFCGFAPWASERLSFSTLDGEPGIDYTVASSVLEQKDILYATTVVNRQDYHQTVPFTFRHALTAIEFRMGFTATVKSVSIENVKNHGFFSYNSGWLPSALTGNETYTVSFGDEGKIISQENQMLTSEGETMILMPQDFEEGSLAKVVLVYLDEQGLEQTVEASLEKSSWMRGRKVIYTLYLNRIESDFVYFDLNWGGVTITDTGYSGYIGVAGAKTLVEATGKTPEQMANTKFYLFQSLWQGDNTNPNHRTKTGYSTLEDFQSYPEKVILPQYAPVMVNGVKWSDYITGNKDIVEVITKWNELVVDSRNRDCEGALRTIVIRGTTHFDVTMDNINLRTSVPQFDAQNQGILTLKLKGENRLSSFKYISRTPNAGKMIITSDKGDGSTSGSLTLCTFSTVDTSTDGVRWGPFQDNSNVLGPNSGESYGLNFNGGTVYGGNPPARNSVWGERITFTYPAIIGGGTNSTGEVIINGGRLTAVSNGTSPAIGGGGGYQSRGGKGLVTINGGEVYAYAKGVYTYLTEYEGYVPAAAIGGAGTIMMDAIDGTQVQINGGYVYAESVGGTAIGGGNSAGKNGGMASVSIGGDAIVIAKSIAGTIATNTGTMEVEASTAIGGGSSLQRNGGSATISITGGRLTTGSIGGGKTGDATGTYRIGSANITLSGEPMITGQFVMAADQSTTNTFEMYGGTIFNNNTSSLDYVNTVTRGGAVYMEGGSCQIHGGTIRNCRSEEGGAIYMSGGDFHMDGGTLTKNTAEGNGGNVYVSGGNVVMSGGTITGGLANDGNGGGIYISGGNFLMPADGVGTIISNAAHSQGSLLKGSGGGVCIEAHSDDTSIEASILSGTISGNTADCDGGGLSILVDRGSTEIVIGRSNGTPADPMIHDNEAAKSGGGMSVSGSTQANVTIYSGTIRGKVTAYVKNEDIRNDGGTVTLIGSTENFDVRYNTVFFHSNNGRNEEERQLIVTDTNSLLSPTETARSWSKEFHELDSWNTKPDGSGIRYEKQGGETMNINQDVHLYAIWRATSN